MLTVLQAAIGGRNRPGAENAVIMERESVAEASCFRDDFFDEGFFVAAIQASETTPRRDKSGLLSVLARLGAFWVPLFVAVISRWPALRVGLSAEEVNLLAVSQLPLHQMISYTFLQELNPPGLQILLAAWSLIAGSSDLALRVFSVLGSVLLVAAGYGLAKALFQSRGLAFGTALLLVAMPLGLNDAQKVTPATWFATAIFISWLALLKLLKTPVESDAAAKCQRRWALFYLLFALLASQLYAAGPLFLGFQALWLSIQPKSSFCSGQRRNLLLLIGLLLALSIPHIVVLLQPWHVAHVVQLRDGGFGWMDFALSPFCLLALNMDRLPSTAMMGDFYLGLMPCYLLVMILIGYGSWRLWKEAPARLLDLGCIGLLPWLTVFLLNGLGLSIFSYHYLLFTAFAFATCVVYALWSMGKHAQKGLSVLILLGLVVMQFNLTPVDRLIGPNLKSMAASLKAFTRPDDGFVIYPGWMALPLQRYFRPATFRIDVQQLALRPWAGENFFQNISQSTGDIFAVTGDAKFLETPTVQATFATFQRHHPRIIITGVNPGQSFPPLKALTCPREILVLVGNTAMPLPCTAAKTSGLSGLMPKMPMPRHTLKTPVSPSTEIMKIGENAQSLP